MKPFFANNSLTSMFLYGGGIAALSLGYEIDEVDDDDVYIGGGVTYPHAEDAWLALTAAISAGVMSETSLGPWVDHSEGETIRLVGGSGIAVVLTWIPNQYDSGASLIGVIITRSGEQKQLIFESIRAACLAYEGV